MTLAIGEHSPPGRGGGGGSLSHRGNVKKNLNSTSHKSHTLGSLPPFGCGQVPWHYKLTEKKKEERQLTIFRSHCPSKKEPKLSDSHKTWFSVITLGTISALKCTWAKDRGFSASSWVSPPHTVQEWRCQELGVTTGVGGDDQPDVPRSFLDCVRQGRGAFSIGWVLRYNLTVLWLFLDPGFHSRRFFHPTRGSTVNIL